MPLIRSNDTEIVYARTAGSRWFSGLAAPFILAMFTALPIMIWPKLPWSAGHSPLELAQPVAFLLFTEMCGIGIFLLGLYGAGPEDLILDRKARTYRFRRGFPILARWKTGPFSDIEGIVLRKTKNKNITNYTVALRWHDSGRAGRPTVPPSIRAMFQDVTLFTTQSETEAIGESRKAVERLSVSEIPETAAATTPEQLSQRSVRTVMLAVSFCALFLVAMYGPPLLLQWQLDTQGRKTQGIVINSRTGNKYSYLTFTYEVDGQNLHGRDDVAWATARDVNLGNTVDVTYLPSDPQTCRTNYSNTRRSTTLSLSLYGGWLVLGSLYSIYRLRRQPLGQQKSS